MKDSISRICGDFDRFCFYTLCYYYSQDWEANLQSIFRSIYGEYTIQNMELIITEKHFLLEKEFIKIEKKESVTDTTLSITDKAKHLFLGEYEVKIRVLQQAEQKARTTSGRLQQDEAKRRNAVKEMPEHSSRASCAMINQIVVQLHDKPDIFNPIAPQKKLELLLIEHAVHVLSGRGARLPAGIKHLFQLLLF